MDLKMKMKEKTAKDVDAKGIINRMGFMNCILTNDLPIPDGMLPLFKRILKIHLPSEIKEKEIMMELPTNIGNNCTLLDNASNNFQPTNRITSNSNAVNNIKNIEIPNDINKRNRKIYHKIADQKMHQIAQFPLYNTDSTHPVNSSLIMVNEFLPKIGKAHTRVTQKYNICGYQISSTVQQTFCEINKSFKNIPTKCQLNNTIGSPYWKNPQYNANKTLLMEVKNEVIFNAIKIFRSFDFPFGFHLPMLPFDTDTHFFNELLNNGGIVLPLLQILIQNLMDEEERNYISIGTLETCASVLELIQRPNKLPNNSNANLDNKIYILAMFIKKLRLICLHMENKLKSDYNNIEKIVMTKTILKCLRLECALILRNINFHESANWDNFYDLLNDYSLNAMTKHLENYLNNML